MGGGKHEGRRQQLFLIKTWMLIKISEEIKVHIVACDLCLQIQSCQPNISLFFV